MKRLLAVTALSLLIGAARAQRPTNDPQAAKILLPNGWSLTPAGTALPLGDLPLNMQLAPDGKLLAVTNNGQSTQTIQLLDPQREKLLDERVIGKAWYGLAFSAKGDKLYASGGNDNIILAYPHGRPQAGRARYATPGPGLAEGQNQPHRPGRGRGRAAALRGNQGGQRPLRAGPQD